MSSQLRFGFTLNFYYLLLSVFVAMVNQLFIFMALKSLMC